LLNFIRAEHAAREALKINLHNAAIYVLLANMYALAGLFDKQQEVWEVMEKNRIKKIPGISTISIDGMYPYHQL
jgi:hypothetical protein